MASKNKAEIRRGVHTRIRKKVSGTEQRPRLAVFRSLNHIYAQVIDDVNGKTLAAASTTEKSLGVKTGGNLAAAQKVGQTIAERALAAGVSQVVFDRGGYVYHGRVKALLDATRQSGLNKNENSSGEFAPLEIKDSADNSATETSDEPSVVESIADTVSTAIKSVGDVLSNLIGGDKTAEDEDSPETSDKLKEENNENQ